MSLGRQTSSTHNQHNILFSALRGSPVAISILTSLSLTSFSLLAFGGGFSNDHFWRNLVKGTVLGGIIGTTIGCGLDLYCNLFPRSPRYCYQRVEGKIKDKEFSSELKISSR